ncbi:MAG: hypothetical protein WKF75_19975 [Singulisphaera sp.]
MIPMAAWARDVDDGSGPALALDAVVFDPDGRERVSAGEVGRQDDPGARQTGCASLRGLGADALLRRVRHP